MYPDYVTPPEQKKTRKILLTVIILGLALFALIAILTLRPKEKFDQGWLHQTNLTFDENYTHLNGSTLYAYNGAAFYSVTRDGKTRVLNAQYRLPLVKKMYWANDSGVMLTFSSSFYASQIQTELARRGISIGASGIENYTWYLDFTDHQLYLVDTLPIIGNLAYYTSKDSGFYYVNELNDGSALHFYDIKAHKNKILVDNLDTSDIGSLTQCSNQKVCFIGRDKLSVSYQRLYGIGQDNKKSLLYNSRGRMFPTSNPNKYVVVATSNEKGVLDTNYDEADFPDSPANLYDVTDKSLRGLGFDIGPTPVSLHFRTDDEFYVFGEQFLTASRDLNETSAYLAGRFKSRGDAKTVLHPLLKGDGSVFTDRLVAQVSEGGGELALLSDADQQQYLFDFSQAGKPLPTTATTAAAKTVDECVKSAALAGKDYFSTERLYRIVFNDTPGFQQKIADFDSCIINAARPPLIGYNFTFVGADPVSGRLVTD
jgi:hypothetical protein